MKKSAKSDKSFAESESFTSKLPPEALKFGKQLGIDFKGLEPEAQEIWRYLNNLSNSDPLEYQKFISQQMQAAKEEEEEKKLAAEKKQKGKASTKAKDSDNSPSEGGYFRPEACFCVKVATVGGDGLKVRDVSEEKLPELTLFVNLCSSKVVDEPTDRSGNKVVDTNLPVADGLQIPLVVGPLRKVDENSNAIDVVFHPIVGTLCVSQRYVRAQITDLALEWVRQEAKVQFDQKKWEDVDPTNIVKYKGGLGDTKDIPVLFHVSPDGETSQPLPAGPANSSVPSSIFPPAPGTTKSAGQQPSKVKQTGTATFSTSSLLSSLQREEEPSITELNLHIPAVSDVSTTGKDQIAKKKGSGIEPVEANPSVKKKFIIEEVGTSSLADELEGEITVSATSIPPNNPAVQLMQEVKSTTKTSNNTSLLDIGSSSSSSTAATAAVEQSNTKPKSKKSVSFEGLRGKLASSKDESVPTQSSNENNKSSLKPPNKATLDDLEAMLSRCDEEFASSALAEEPDMSNLAASTSILSDLAKAFGSTQDAGLSALLSETLAQAQRFDSKPSHSSGNTAVAAPTIPSPATTTVASKPIDQPSVVIGVSHPKIIQATCSAKDEETFEIVIEGIKNTTNAADLVLEASSQVVKVRTDITSYSQSGEASGKSLVEVFFKIPNRQINPTAIAASFKKKAGKFTVTVGTKSL